MQPPPPPQRSTLLIPGPIEFDDAVLQSMAHYSESHVGPGFVSKFGKTLSLVREILQSSNPSAQPYIISGSGTLGWDMVAANLIERGDEVLVLTTGYFGHGFAECLTSYGAVVTILESPIGGRPQLSLLEEILVSKEFKALIVTHVDTSTGVLNPLKDLARLVKTVAPQTLFVVDGVCSVACEEIAFDAWELDVVLTASQKAIGCPAGLSISLFSGNAIRTFAARKLEPASYYASLEKWTPVMRSYEANKASYFATPPTQLIRALHEALMQIVATPLAERFARHREVSDSVKKTIAVLGLQQIAPNPEDQAHGMTAVYLPEGIKSADFLAKMSINGVIWAGGIHKGITREYVRFGHMGLSVMGSDRKDIIKALKALANSLRELGYQTAYL